MLPRSPAFVTTHWSVVLTAGRNDTTLAKAALEKLCQTYWYPLYAYARRRGQLITQEELSSYTRWLAVGVTEAMHYFIGHCCPAPRCAARYQAVSGAHITHMLRDAVEDADAGYFNIPVDHLYATPVTVDYFRKLRLKDLVVVSPDPGGLERAHAFAKRLKAPLAILDKRRQDADVVEMMNVIGDVVGKNCLIVDDMIDTGGTLVRGAQALLEKGAHKILACCTHGVFARDAIQRICDSPLEQVVATNSIPLSEEGEKCGKIKVLSVAKLLARAIQSIHQETSVSKLFI